MQNQDEVYFMDSIKMKVYTLAYNLFTYKDHR